MMAPPLPITLPILETGQSKRNTALPGETSNEEKPPDDFWRFPFPLGSAFGLLEDAIGTDTSPKQ